MVSLTKLSWGILEVHLNRTWIRWSGSLHLDYVHLKWFMRSQWRSVSELISLSKFGIISPLKRKFLRIVFLKGQTFTSLLHKKSTWLNTQTHIQAGIVRPKLFKNLRELRLIQQINTDKNLKRQFEFQMSFPRSFSLKSSKVVAICELKLSIR